MKVNNVLVSIPAYNEEKDIQRVLREINSVFKKTKYKYKILVVNDGSIDDTEKIAKKEGAIVVSNPYNLGLAETFRTEIRECLKRKFDVVIHTDADGQYPAEHILDLIKEIEKGYDLILGSRFRGRIEKMPLMKRVGNILFSKAISQIVNYKITDAQTGFRAFNRKVAQLNIISNHTYTQEQIIRTKRNKLKIKEIPIYARKTRPSKLMKSKVKILQPFEFALKAWINIFRIYRDFDPLKFFSVFGLVLFVPGFLLGLSLFIRFLMFGAVGRIPSVVLSSLLIISGLQIILFGFLADMNRK